MELLQSLASSATAEMLALKLLGQEVASSVLMQKAVLFGTARFTFCFFGNSSPSSISMSSDLLFCFITALAKLALLRGCDTVCDASLLPAFRCGHGCGPFAFACPLELELLGLAPVRAEPLSLAAAVFSVLSRAIRSSYCA